MWPLQPEGVSQRPVNGELLGADYFTAKKSDQQNDSEDADDDAELASLDDKKLVTLEAKLPPLLEPIRVEPKVHLFRGMISSRLTLADLFCQ